MEVVLASRSGRLLPLPVPVPSAPLVTGVCADGAAGGAGAMRERACKGQQ